LDVHLHRQKPFFSYLVQELVHHLEGALITLPGERRTLDHTPQSGRHSFDNVQRIGHEQRARCRARDDQKFSRLQQDHDVALLHQKAADYRYKHQDYPYDGEHSCPQDADVMQLPPAWILDSMAFCARSSNCASPASWSWLAWIAPMLTVSEIRSPHHRKSAVLANPASACACAASISG